MRVWVKPSATFPPFAQPMVVSYFSLDQDRRFAPDLTQLRYMHLPREAESLGWDLNHGIDKVQRSDHAKSNERIDNLLRGVLASGLAVSPEVASIMCLRGLLTKIMTTPYEQNQGWEILVSKFRGVLFLCAQETPEQRRERMSRDEAQQRFCHWGFKFEQYMSTDQPGCPPDVDMPVKEGEEFCCLFRTKLNDRRLIYGAEMDAVTSEVPLEDCLEDLMLAEFIELKTSRKLECVRQERNFKRFKLLNWWAQNFLVNVAHIICGFRDDRGIVDNIAFYKVEEIPKLAKDLWVPAVCMTFLDQFLSFATKTVRECPQSNDPFTVWRFRWEPGVHFVTGDMIAGRSQFSFLPDWFLSSVVARDNHPLDCSIRIYSSKHGKAVTRDDQHVHTTKVFELAKNIANHRAKSKRPPSPRSILQGYQRLKAPANVTSDSTSTQPASNSDSTTSNNSSVPAGKATGKPATPHQPPPLARNEPPPVPQASDRAGNEATNAPHTRNVNGPSRPRSRRHRRRNRQDHHSQPHSSSQRTSVDKSERLPFQSAQLKNSVPPRPKLAKLDTSGSETVPSQVGLPPVAVETSQDHFNSVSDEQSSASPNALPSIHHPEGVVYAQAFNSLDEENYLMSQTSEDLSSSNTANQFTSQSYLTTPSSEQDDSYSQHTMLSNSFSSSSMMSDCYSSHTFSVCDELTPTTYLVPTDSDFLEQEEYMQHHTTDHSYLSSPSAVEYISEPPFLPVSATDGPEVYLNETTDDLPQSSLLGPVASISQTYLNSNTHISSEDIQTAEGSLTTINHSAYLPSSASANHLTLQM